MAIDALPRVITLLAVADAPCEPLPIKELFAPVVLVLPALLPMAVLVVPLVVARRAW